MRAGFAIALGAGAALLLYKINANASAIDNPDESFATELENLVPDLPLFADKNNAGTMQTSDQGITAIKQREGFSAVKYPDASGFSIGYGHFIKPGETFDEPMSEDDAENILLDDVSIAQDAVNNYVNVILTQNQFDALVSLAYNIGVHNFLDSTLLKLVNAGDFAGAAAQFDRWDRSAGQVSTALVNRRASEKAQFLA